MNKIYLIEASNHHQYLISPSIERWEEASDGLNRQSLEKSWSLVKFSLEGDGRKATKVPTSCIVYVPGILVFRGDFVEKLFPAPRRGLELLDVEVDGRPWKLLNCLNSIATYDRESSEVMRGDDGEIFLVLSLSTSDPSAKNFDIFTLEGSNRMQVFARGDFVARYKALGVEGLTFRAVGQMCL